MKHETIRYMVDKLIGQALKISSLEDQVYTLEQQLDRKDEDIDCLSLSLNETMEKLDK